MTKSIKYYLKNSLEGVINSYSQVFFSNDRLFGLLLLIITFFDLGAGFAGLLSIILVQVIAYFFNFNHALIKDGSYTYNALMVGIALGAFYQFNWSLLFLIVALSLLTLMLTIWFANSLGHKGLPFLIGIWVVILGASNFSALDLNQKSFYSLQKWLPGLFSATTDGISSLPFHNVIYLYLRSVGAIFFQYNDLAGIIIVIGLIYYSRIAFALSIFGFSIGYLFYHFMGGDFSQLIYSYIGFNFILTAIALGGIIVAPSRRSFLQLIFTIPLIAILVSALHGLFTQFNLPLYSLPFNLVVLLFVTALHNRTKISGLSLVTIQEFSPEKHHYNYYNNTKRFQKDTYIHLGLPVIGEWFISQGYDGKITHRDEWQHALDFDVRDEDGSSYKMPGYETEDYYCWDLPVIAPADGTVIEVVNDIEDNHIGKVNLENNWVNTVIIQHGEYLFSKISHFKKDTIQVEVGTFVKKGTLLGKCGSSGQSPEPHLHFQMQTTPYIGSKTLEHPISYYISKQNGRNIFKSFEIPEEGETVCNLKNTRLLKEAFDWIPGKTIKTKNNQNKTEIWEVLTTPQNQTYVWCKENDAVAWFVNNKNVFYFTAFTGDKSSMLYQFYLGAYKVPLGYYENLELNDNMNLMPVAPKALLWLHNFTAPLFHYLKASYDFQFTASDNDHDPFIIDFKTRSQTSLFGKTRSSEAYHFKVEEKSIALSNNKEETIVCEWE
ncbi:urea transporter [Flavobacteriales bacterium]|nr:urea transporter [Flavobacteriales bacterium]